MTWSLNDKCPECGHRAAIHCGPGAESSPPGTCWEPTDDGGWCQCPGWHPLLEEVVTSSSE